MKRIIALVLVTIMCVALAACASSSGTAANNTAQTAAAATTTPKMVVKVSHNSKEGSARDLGAQKLKEVVEAKSNGTIEVQVYPNSQLGTGTDLIEGIQANTIEIIITPTSFMGGYAPMITLTDIPYLFPTDYEKLIEIEHGPAMKEVLATTEDINIHVCDIWHTGYKTFTAKTPLEKPEDFKGLKFRVMPSQVLIKQYELLGATPVNMDFSECYNALQTGAIDGQENPFDTTTDMNFHEVQKYCVVSKHGVLDQMILASKVWWDGLTPEQQQIFNEAMEEARKVCVEATNKVQDESRKKMEDAGIKIYELSDAEIAEWKEVLAPCRDEFIKVNGEKGKELLEKVEAEVAAMK